MNSTRTQFLAGLAILLTIVVLGAIVGGMLPLSPGPDDGPGEQNGVESYAAPDPDDRPDDPSTNDTIGYVDGYWYDDDLPVDERDDAALEPDELDAVVARSMARVEVIRNQTFENEASVEVVSREEYQGENGDLFTNATEDERLQQNVNYEALFMVDRDTDAAEAFESLYGGAVDGYYDPATDEIVIVSDSPDSPEVDEIVLGHELVHALQDQHFDLMRYERETIDQDTAKNGLIEGDAVRVETEYEQRCAEEWTCFQPERTPPDASELNWGLYLTLFQPYDDGPDYVDYLIEQDGWNAVNGAYDDPPASTAEVIRPGEEREPAAIDIDDRSNEEWGQLEVNGEVATESVGEAGLVSMFAAGVFERGQPSVIDRTDFIGPEMGYEFDQPITDGWAGDELVTYVAADGDETEGETDDATDAVDDTGYVWRTEWLSDEDATQFTEAYLELLAQYGADPVADHRNTYEIDDEYPGAYYVETDGETVTIVRAPTVDDLDAIESGAAPTGDDTLALGDDNGEANENAEPDDERSLLAGMNPGFGTVTAAFVSIAVLGSAGWLVLLRRRGDGRESAAWPRPQAPVSAAEHPVTTQVPSARATKL